MKIAIYSDNHWSQYSSILRRRGNKYSYRLENQIESLNWFYKLAESNECNMTFMLGDFFDKSELVAEELSALKEVNWGTLPNYFICGNHEMGTATHSYSSAKLFELLPTAKVFADPEVLDYGDFEIAILPYILEENREEITSYIGKPNKKRLLLSHNDIAGIQMGPIISKSGFTIDEIEANCDLCINGHLHNGDKISNKIINIGNLTGQNFSEDAFKYDHTAFIIDTDTFKVQVFANPYAINFYKLDNIKQLDKITSNAVVTLKCKEADAKEYRDILKESDKVIEYRVIIEAEKGTKEVVTESLSIDHIDKFREYILETLGNTDIVIQELTEVCR